MHEYMSSELLYFQTYISNHRQTRYQKGYGETSVMVEKLIKCMFYVNKHLR